MADASGSSHYWAIEEESVFGTTPSPFNPQQYRFLEGGDAVDNRSTLVSNELTSDRQLRSSTLGTPSPEFSPSFELSAQSFDLLIEGALQSNWVGDGYASGVTVDVSASNTLTTDGGETWARYNFADSDVITITGLTVSSEDGSYLISSGSSTDTITVTDLSGGAVTFTAEVDATLTVIAGRSSVVIDSSTNNITVAASGNTITAASGIWTSASPDIRYGDLIYLAGFSNAANNGYHKVTGVTSTVLTISSDSTLVNETLSSGNLEVANNTAFVTAGSTRHSYSIESGYTDIDLYRTLRGTQIGSMSLSYATDSIVTGDFSMMGLSLSDFAVSSEATSVADPTTTPVFNTFRGYVSFDGSAPSCLLSMDVSLDNSSEGLQCLFTDTLSSITHGKSLVTGSLTAYLSDSTLSTKYSSETNITIYVVAEDADGRTIGVGMDNVQLQGEAIQVNETTVEISFDFAALYSDAVHKNIYFIESREIPA